MQFERGQLADALKKAQQGFQDSSKDPVWNWKFRVLKAEVLVWQTKSKDTLDLLSATPPSELVDGEFAVRAIDAEGLALLALHRYSDADDRFNKAEVLAVHNAPQMLCDVFQNEGTSAFRQKQYNKADDLFHRALQASREHRNKFIEASALGSIGLVSTNVGHFEAAIEWLSKSLDLAYSSQYHLIEYISRLNVGWSYEQLGDSEKALTNFHEAEKVIDSFDQEQLKASFFRSIGEVYLLKKNYSAARQSFLKSFQIAEKMHQDKRANEEPAMAAALSDIAAVALEEGKPEEAEEYDRRALALKPTFSNAILISARIAMARRDFNRANSLLLDAIQASKDEQFNRWQSKAELANVYAAQHKDVLAEKQFQDVIAEFDTIQNSMKDLESKLAFSLQADRLDDDYINFLVSRSRNDKALQVAEFSRARTLSERVGIKAPRNPAGINIEHIRNFLRKENKLVLAYWLAGDKSYLWAIPPSGKISLLPLPEEEKIEHAIREYQDILQGPEDKEEIERKAASLYEMLISPAQKEIAAGSKVVIVPDGPLYALNFETLQVPGSKPHYWIEDVELENVSSMLLFTQKKGDSSRRNQNLLLLGNPVEASSDYPALRHAAEEIARVQRHFSPAQETVISQRAAVPSIYQNSHPDHFDVIHFVTHGTASEISPLESAIILSPENDTFKLYAHDVINIPIKANVVTISACYGAGKRTYSREGLVGLAWAFLGAGAHQVVAGLWEVDDQATPELMDNFYGGLQNGQTAATALRSAKLAMLHAGGKHARPYYWASLQLYAGA